MNHRYSDTEKRRAIQPLWNALEQDLLSVQSQGLVLAVSGGMDSLALMESYARWAEAEPHRIWVASLDHGQRDESAAECERVVKRAQVLGFKGFSDAFKGGKAQNEASLRKWRYDILRKLMAKESLYGVVTAHHLSDDAEGYAMNLLGLGGGAQGRAMKSSQKHGDMVLIRPFMNLSRETLALALGAMGLSHHVLSDPSDAKDQNWRAFVRHEIFPSLQRIQPRIAERLSQKAKEQDEVLSSFEVLSSQYVYPSPHGGYLVSLEIPTEFLLKMMCILALKKVAPHSDMRAGEKTLTTLCQKVVSKSLIRNKVFEFSGACIEATDGFLWVRVKK